MPVFSHLHVHTQYSLLDGAADIKKLYKKAMDDNMPALAITDHGNMFGAFEFVAEAYKHKVNPDDKNSLLKGIKTWLSFARWGILKAFTASGHALIRS
jgi:histidinol phosphatase-like PHP family hydrolase